MNDRSVVGIMGRGGGLAAPPPPPPPLYGFHGGEAPMALAHGTILSNMSPQKHIVWRRPFWNHGEIASRDWLGLTTESRSMLQDSAIRLVGEPICVTIGARSYDVPGGDEQEDLR